MSGTRISTLGDRFGLGKLKKFSTQHFPLLKLGKKRSHSPDDLSARKKIRKVPQQKKEDKEGVVAQTPSQTAKTGKTNDDTPSKIGVQAKDSDKESALSTGHQGADIANRCYGAREPHAGVDNGHDKTLPGNSEASGGDEQEDEQNEAQNFDNIELSYDNDVNDETEVYVEEDAFDEDGVYDDEVYDEDGTYGENGVYPEEAELRSAYDNNADLDDGSSLGLGETLQGVHHEAEAENDEETYSEHESEDEDGSPLDQFEPVLQNLRLTSLKTVALNLRQRLQLEAGESMSTACEVYDEPTCGSYNLVYFIIFDDGVHWVAKIPGYGAAPSPLQKEKMDCEYRTMRFMRSTTFKLPDVFCWDTSPDTIGAAFGLMSFVPGRSLWDRWQDEEFDQAKCLTAVASVATEMAKLYCVQFSKTGMLRFDGDRVIGVDYEIEYQTTSDAPWGDTRKLGPFESTSDWIRKDIRDVSKRVGLLTHYLRRSENSDIQVKKMLETIPRYMRDAPLSLCVADPDFQNIFVDENGEVTGFIDLDNVRVAPVIVGSAAYPPFITRDRNPGKYMDEVTDLGFYHPHGGMDADRNYRQHYAASFKAALPEGTIYDPRWTELSHHVCMLECASTAYAIPRVHILDEMAKDAYRYVYGQAAIDGGHQSLVHQDTWSPQNMIRMYRFKRTIAKGLWISEATSGAAVLNVATQGFQSSGPPVPIFSSAPQVSQATGPPEPVFSSSQQEHERASVLVHIYRSVSALLSPFRALKCSRRTWHENETCPTTPMHGDEAPLMASEAQSGTTLANGVCTGHPSQESKKQSPLKVTFKKLRTTAAEILGRCSRFVHQIDT
ncbi:hypothetical protein PMZ80_001783 [Knufia obscura]|uniref:Aminoglycoside phosphotransferase domain-containing protein n=1 Tax=Knufia obscura TaxID=1635080 RepID=A0ABR0S529_9EURO|nr:hypothetical protein PMZ80_001783 [Knufia obscura]